MTPLRRLQTDLRAKANPTKAKIYSGFFKTAPGEYGHGDIFLGLTVPQQRTLAKNFYHLSLTDIQKLLKSKIHEERFTALVILVRQFQIGNNQKQIYTFYLKKAARVNNWDLVDTSAPQIVGGYLWSTTRPPLNPLLKRRGGANPPLSRGGWGGVSPVLTTLAHSPNLWERRIAILATFAFIRHNKFSETLHLAKLLLNDEHDLIHKAVGWMLREVGKKSEVTLKKFLDQHHRAMPRTMLRYAIEKFSSQERRHYLTSR